MTDTTEKVILSVEIDQSEALKKSAALSKEIKDLTEANKALAKSGKDTSVEYQENARLAKSLTDQKRSLDRQIDQSVKAFNAETGSIKQLRAEVSILTDQYNSLSAEERDNSSIGKDLQATIKGKTDRLKELEGAIGDNRRNVGNYRDALQGMVSEFEVAGINIGSVIQNFKTFEQGVQDSGIKMNSFNGILKANLIGVLITLFAGLIAAMTRFKPVADKVEQVFSGINAAVNAVVGSLINVGNGLIKIAKGEFSQGINEIRTAFDGLGESIKTAYQAGAEFAELQQEIDDQTRETSITNSKLNKEIDKLLLQSRNRTLSEQERLKLLDKASKLETQALANSLAVANKERELSQKKYDEAVRTKQLNDEIENARAASIVKIYELESQSINLQEKISNRRDALLQEQAQNQQKLLEAAKKASEELAAFDKFYTDYTAKIIQESIEKELADLEAASQYKVSLTEQEANDILEIRKLSNEEIATIAGKSRDEQIKYINQIKSAELEAQKVKAEAALSSVSTIIGALNQLSANSGQNAEFAKTLSIAQATINTFEGATKAFAQGGPLGFITGAAVIAAGLANVARIVETDIPKVGGAAAGGGSFMTKGPTMLMVGDNPGGVERIDVTPLSGRGKTRINPNSNLVAMAGGGSLVTGFGGFAERNSSKSDFTDYDKLAKAVEKVKIYATISEIEKAGKVRANKIKVSEI
jgi:myosin heavy subunit